MADQGRLDAEAVDTVDDKIILGSDQAGDILHGDEIIHQAALAGRIDIRHPRSHDFYLGSAQGGVQGGQLAVDIGFRHMIHIDEGQLTNGAARQGFHSPGTHPANANNADPGTAKALQSLLTIQAGQAAKSPLKIHQTGSCYIICCFFECN